MPIDDFILGKLQKDNDSKSNSGLAEQGTNKSKKKKIEYLHLSEFLRPLQISSA